MGERHPKLLLFIRPNAHGRNWKKLKESRKTHLKGSRLTGEGNLATKDTRREKGRARAVDRTQKEKFLAYRRHQHAEEREKSEGKEHYLGGALSTIGKGRRDSVVERVIRSRMGTLRRTLGNKKLLSISGDGPRVKKLCREKKWTEGTSTKSYKVTDEPLHTAACIAKTGTRRKNKIGKQKGKRNGQRLY